MATIKLEIFTPYKKYFSEEVDFITIQNNDALLGILPNQSPLITSVEISKMHIRFKGKDNVYAIGGGVLKIKNNEANLLLHSIEREDEIDLNRAIEAKERAEKRLQSAKKEKVDIKRAELALSRALVRISVKNYNKNK